MEKKILIDATHPEELRMSVVRDGRVEEFDVESQKRQHIKGNIYLAQVVRIEPSLQAAFIDYGFGRHGFLPFSEIHPGYYEIPVGDQKRSLQQQADAPTLDSEAPKEEGARPEDETLLDIDSIHNVEGVTEEGTQVSESVSMASDLLEEEEAVDFKEDTETAEEKLSVSSESDRVVRPHFSKKYKIQEVIKRNRVLLVQVIKEERGNKGAALTTYISLPGRYCILLPNILRGGGISRKIRSEEERDRIKKIVDSLGVETGMGVVVRTVGENKTKAEIKKDYDYLIRLWESLKEKTMHSKAPEAIYDDGNLIKRSIRDIYDKDVSEIIVDGEDAYKQARQAMRLFAPSQMKVIRLHKGERPLFQTHAIEEQLEELFETTVPLRSGGYLVINRTEALTSIDVNSGKSTKERNIEVTAVKTNLEAVDEVARQLRLRDISGLIVIDFIDMEEGRNNRAVEARIRDALKTDRAHTQIGRISPFGLLEMSRQRLRTMVTDNLSQVCGHCAGSGVVRSSESIALRVLRAMEELCIQKKDKGKENYTLRTTIPVLMILFNQKRHYISYLESKYEVSWTLKLLATDPTSSMPEGSTVEASAAALYRIEDENGRVLAPLGQHGGKKEGSRREQRMKSPQSMRQKSSHSHGAGSAGAPSGDSGSATGSGSEGIGSADEASPQEEKGPSASSLRRRRRNAARHRKKEGHRSPQHSRGRREGEADKGEKAAAAPADAGAGSLPLSEAGRPESFESSQDAAPRDEGKGGSRRWLLKRILNRGAEKESLSA